jgi:uncharacterized C2H2 Zn-finger protein
MKNKVIIKTQDAEICLEGDCSIKKLCNQAHDLLIKYSNYQKSIGSDMSCKELQVPEQFFKKPVAINKPDRELSRNFRNESDIASGKNVVNLKDYKIETAKTENVLVRCSECGQGYVAVFKDDAAINKEQANVLLVRHDNNFDVIGFFSDEDIDNILKPEEASYTDYYDDISHLEPIKDTNVNLTGEHFLYCPICRSLKPFKKWIDAYRKPEDYFEYNNICDICGGEMTNNITKDGEELICEKCGSKKIF